MRQRETILFAIHITRTAQNTGKSIHSESFDFTVEPRFTDAHKIQTPHYFGQFSLSLGKALSTRLIWTPVNADS